MSKPFKTLRVDVLDLRLLIDSVEHLYESGEYNRDDAHNLQFILVRLRKHYGDLSFVTIQEINK